MKAALKEFRDTFRMACAFWVLAAIFFSPLFLFVATLLFIFKGPNT